MQTGRLEIHLFGELRVVRDGVQLALPASKKTRALLAYLIATQRPQSRARLCDLLWEGPSDPRAGLRWSLAKLRPLIDHDGAQRLVADREQVGFEAHAARVDLYELREQARAALTDAPPLELLEALLSELRGELLEGLDLPDCYSYSEWCRAEREAARSARRALRLIVIERLPHAPEQALAHARALAIEDLLTEAGHLAVMKLLLSLGRQKEALRQYEICKQILASELRSQPSAELERLRSTLSSTAGSAPPTPSTTPPATPPATPPVIAPATAPPMAAAVDSATRSEAQPAMVGRAAERAALARFVSAHADGDRVLLVLGEPGVGKTRLLRELADCTAAVGGTVLRGRAFEAEMVRPYGAWIDALRSRTTQADTGRASDPFHPGIRDSAFDALPHRQHEAGAERTRLFDAVVAELRSHALNDRPVVVILDDVHWIDDASAALIHYTARALEGSLVRIACAARPGELADNHAARKLMRALTRESRVMQIGLSPLDARETAELVLAAGSPSDPVRVFAESGGNPLFALEVASALASGGRSTGSLDALLHDRLDRLDDDTRELLSWAAALGGAFSTELLLGVSGQGAMALARTLAELERRGFIREASLGSTSSTSSTSSTLGYDFVHDLLRRATYHSVSEPRRRLMHAALARALSQLADADGGLAGDVAHHAAIGGDDELAARASLAAAERCLRLYANADASELVTRGLHFATRLPAEQRVQLQISLLRVAIHADPTGKRGRDVEPAMQRALHEAQAIGKTAQVAQALIALSFLHYDRGNFAGAAHDSLRAEQSARSGDPGQALRTVAHAAQCLALIERELPRAESLLAEASSLSAELAIELAEISMARGFISYHYGDVAGASSALHHALLLLGQRSEPWLQALCMVRLATIELQARAFSTVLELCQQLREVSARMGEASELPMAAVLEAVARRQLGEANAAHDAANALQTLRSLDAKVYLAEALCLVAETEHDAGELSAADGYVREALEYARLVDRPSLVVFSHALLARFALDRADTTAARRELNAAEALLPGPVSALALAKLQVVARRLESPD